MRLHLGCGNDYKKGWGDKEEERRLKVDYDAYVTSVTASYMSTIQQYRDAGFTDLEIEDMMK